ncbi:hypothetical protein ONS95_008933 [Cadophora gregata]|uniref:uncharacterized protein n=1 Tax=Cadophora gregata TaxID=51156 RepID=UPI0026DB6858|nr:uncharacterized protein ONS95_008933 [Cadophora gregata]KAK0123943.1 hypothetical protein ONS95_008933 [Cadophora gregata]KAK0130282.1 hypothetical protein ONS96_000805 [Cadophora gregata f. sp. sojae]
MSTYTSNSSGNIVKSVTGKKITRRRDKISCIECNRRKVKCNREWPCQPCLARKSGHMCRYAASTLSPKTRTQGARQLQDRSPCELDEARNDLGSLESEDNVDEAEMPLVLVEKGLAQLGLCDKPSSTINLGSGMKRARADILKFFPSRQEVDFLIQHFLDKVNWTYEYITPVIFLERYGAWWSQSSYDGSDDILFGTLILRLCTFSLQHLPNPDYPTDGFLDYSVDTMEARCDELARHFDSYRPRPPSVIRVQYMVLHAVTLVTAGDPKDGYQALLEATKEAHAIDLFNEERWPTLHDAEAETRRKIFWLLYNWDRFFCAYYGRWPLIPEDYCTVTLPSELPYTTTLDPDIPTQITDNILGIKTYQFVRPFISAPAKKHERLDPFKVAEHVKAYQTQITDCFPAAFRLIDPDTSYDSTIQNLDLKRIKLHALSWGVVEGMLRCFIGPRTLKSLQAQVASPDRARVLLAEEHRHTLADACFKSVDLMLDLHKRMGGGQTRYWAIPAAMIEYGGVMGGCLISDALIKKNWKKTDGVFRAFDENRSKIYIDGFEKAVKLLGLLAERSPLAKGGLGLLNKTLCKIRGENFVRPQTTSDDCEKYSTTTETPAGNQLDQLDFSQYPGYGDGQVAENQSGTSIAFSFGMLEPDPIMGEWEAVPNIATSSWFIEHETYDFGMQFGDELS